MAYPLPGPRRRPVSQARVGGAKGAGAARARGAPAPGAAGEGVRDRGSGPRDRRRGARAGERCSCVRAWSSWPDCSDVPARSSALSSPPHFLSSPPVRATIKRKGGGGEGFPKKSCLQRGGRFPASRPSRALLGSLFSSPAPPVQMGKKVGRGERRAPSPRSQSFFPSAFLTLVRRLRS